MGKGEGFSAGSSEQLEQDGLPWKERRRPADPPLAKALSFASGTTGALERREGVYIAAETHLRRALEEGTGLEGCSIE